MLNCPATKKLATSLFVTAGHKCTHTHTHTHTKCARNVRERGSQTQENRKHLSSRTPPPYSHNAERGREREKKMDKTKTTAGEGKQGMRVRSGEQEIEPIFLIWQNRCACIREPQECGLSLAGSSVCRSMAALHI